MNTNNNESNMAAKASEIMRSFSINKAPSVAPASVLAAAPVNGKNEQIVDDTAKNFAHEIEQMTMM